MTVNFRTIDNVFLTFLESGESEGLPTVAQVKEILRDNGFNESNAREIPKGTALSRVVQAMAGKQADGSVIKASSLKTGTGDSHKVRWQLSKLVADPENPEKIKSSWQAGWTLNGDNVVRPVDGSSDISLAVDLAMQQYEPSDVTGLFKAVLKSEGDGAYAMRDAVWCIPTRGSDILDRLGRVMARCGRPMIVCALPDTGAAKQAVANAITASLVQEIETHTVALNGYTPEQTKAGVVENCRLRIAGTRQLCERVAEHIGEKAQEILMQLAALDSRAEGVMQAIQSYRAPASGGGRLVMTPAPIVSQS